MEEVRAATFTWKKILADLLTRSDQASPRDLTTLEILGYQSITSMQFPLLKVAERKLSNQFAAAEALWILEGSNRLDRLIPYAPKYSRFSDDGRTLFGAYGPHVITQIPYVVRKLTEDRETRQAVIDIWQRNPPNSKDIPCTLSLQFLWRLHKLNLIVTMRSSDVWLGWPYDVFSFSMIAHYVNLSLHPSIRPPIGYLYLNAGSQHLYSKDIQVAELCLQSTKNEKYLAIQTHDLLSPDHLLACLRFIRDGHGMSLGDNIPPFFQEVLNATKIQA